MFGYVKPRHAELRVREYDFTARRIAAFAAA